MKVNIGNVKYLGQKNLNLNKREKDGILATSILATSDDSILDYKKREINSMVSEREVEISLDDINCFKIILNDCDCSDAFFDKVCQKLEEDGIQFNKRKNSQNLDEDNSIVITLDQQYTAGSNTLIFAPYNNTRIGYSDSLALSMQAAFKQNGFLDNSIFCGKVGYRLDENGNVCTNIPTETEEAINMDSDVSFVTISFGTQNINANSVAKSIKNALARQIHYLNKYDTGLDLIYRATPKDKEEVIADYFNTDTKSLKEYNNIGNQGITDSQAIINPDVNNMNVYSQKLEINIVTSKTHHY